MSDLERVSLHRPSSGKGPQIHKFCKNFKPTSRDYKVEFISSGSDYNRHYADPVTDKLHEVHLHLITVYENLKQYHFADSPITLENIKDSNEAMIQSIEAMLAGCISQHEDENSNDSWRSTKTPEL